MFTLTEHKHYESYKNKKTVEKNILCCTSQDPQSFNVYFKTMKVSSKIQFINQLV